MKYYYIFFIVILTAACNNTSKTAVKAKVYPFVGHIERIDSRIDAVIPKGAKIEHIATGLTWAEGPLWIESEKMLLCSDVKMDRIHKWTEEEGLSVYIEPSGFTGANSDSREKGSNGLVLNSAGELVLCQHGNRQIAKMMAPLNAPASKFSAVVDRYDSKKFNSPNDLVYDSKGNLFFTDPPFGLSEAMMDDPNKELDFQGIYKYTVDKKLILLSDEVSRPNGLAFSPDESKLYIANTDGNEAQWLSFDVRSDTLINKTVIYDATSLIGKESGFPDGVKVDSKGNIFTAGPGGIWIFSDDFVLLGKIKSGFWSSNCNFDGDYSTLYITADDHLLRVKLK